MILLLISILCGGIQLGQTALPQCENPGCPPAGLWSEWVITGKQECSASCGSCDTLYYTRSCMSANAGCECGGVSSRYIPCNTQTCIYPAQRTCCIPYLSMFINGSMQCGPLPKAPTGPAACCPSGGLWTEWSKFGRNDANTQWIRTRDCITEEFGCGCTGVSLESQATCPCKVFDGVGSTCPGALGIASTWTAGIDTCELIYKMEATNDLGRVCNRITTWRDLNFVASFNVLYQGQSSCVNERQYYCDSAGNPDKTVDVTFTCDLDSLYWIFDATAKRVQAFGQIKVAAT